MTIEVTEDQARAIRLVGWFMACFDAGRELDGDERLRDDVPFLHYVAHGATAIVTAGDLRAIGGIE